MTSETEMVTVEEHNHKKGRHRKKQLYNSILQQMEFYFSDSNLAKDRFLGQLLKDSPYVDLDVFLKFNKLRKLTTNLDDIKKAIKNSTLIELNDSETGVCRKLPIKQKDDVDDCTIYVEGFKSDTDHDWVKSIFNEFGNVVYVSLPKYKNRNTIKGFGFIEYDNQQDAQNALNYFESIGAKMSNTTTEPSQLCSIVSYEVEQNANEDNNKDNNNTNNKSNDNNKNSNGDDNKMEEQETRKRKLDDSDVQENDNAKRVKIESEVTESDSEMKKKKKQHKKEYKKRQFIKELGLKVLSKKEWKKMRNRYLELQRKKMKEFKQHLLRAKYSQNNYDDNKSKPINEVNEEKAVDPKLEFVPGVVVKIKLPEPCTDIKKLKTEIRTNYAEIKFIDIPLTVTTDEVFVRFSDSKNADEFCKQDFNGEKHILQGDEEKAYWDKLLECREKKFKKSVKKQRGRDKLRKKANKIMATHIKFDD